MNIDLSINGCSHSIKMQFDDKKEDYPVQKFELRQERLQDAIQTKLSHSRNHKKVLFVEYLDLGSPW